MTTTTVRRAAGAAGIRKEFEGAELGDPRRRARAVKIAEAMAGAPSSGFPQIVADGSELEGLYRFLSNPHVGFDALLEAHVQQTARRAAASGEVVVSHDTTSFEFHGAGQVEELGYLNTGKRGFYCHASLVLDGHALKLPLGVIATKVWSRSAPRKGPKKKLSGAEYAGKSDRESARWLEQVNVAEKRLSENVRAIHVADREADSYALLAQLIADDRHFVIRMSKDRLASKADRSDEFCQIRELIHEQLPMLEREVPLSRRRKKTAPQANRTHPPRQPRLAKLRAYSAPICLKRPRYLRAPMAPLLSLNLVRVFEVDAPEDVEPIDWMLFTTEPVKTSAEIEKVIDYYRGRWVIEEFFKAIKSGCAYEKRQVESKHALLSTLAITLPVAWQLLCLRGLERSHPDAPASVVLTARQITVLRACAKDKYKVDLPASPLVRDVLRMVARFGGFLTWNRQPGWMVLARGMNKLRDYEHGWRMAVDAMKRGVLDQDSTM